MKVTQIVVELKEGLPNYSSRSASVTVVADADESLDVESYISGLQAQIRAGFRAEARSAEVPAQAPVEQKRGRGRPRKEEALPAVNAAAASVVEDFFDE